MPSLPELQHGFFRALRSFAASGDDDAALDPALASVVATASLTAVDRLRIYADMYWMRIVDALAEDFPRVVASIGSERFHALGRAYLASTPSTHPSLRHVGDGFADFLAAHARALPPFVPDLARLERARLSVFDAHDPRPLRLEELRRLAPETWADLALRMISACEILHLDWPVHDIWAASEPAAQWQPRRTVLRVWRREFAVYQTSMDPLELVALERVRASATFADVCAALVPIVPEDRGATEAGSLLLRWVEDALLERTL